MLIMHAWKSGIKAAANKRDCTKLVYLFECQKVELYKCRSSLLLLSLFKRNRTCVITSSGSNSQLVIISGAPLKAIQLLQFMPAEHLAQYYE